LLLHLLRAIFISFKVIVAFKLILSVSRGLMSKCMGVFLEGIFILSMNSFLYIELLKFSWKNDLIIWATSSGCDVEVCSLDMCNSLSRLSPFRILILFQSSFELVLLFIEPVNFSQDFFLLLLIRNLDLALSLLSNMKFSSVLFFF
jgi:hypothetical protein